MSRACLLKTVFLFFGTGIFFAQSPWVRADKIEILSTSICEYCDRTAIKIFNNFISQLNPDQQVEYGANTSWIMIKSKKDYSDWEEIFFQTLISKIQRHSGFGKNLVNLLFTPDSRKTPYNILRSDISFEIFYQFQQFKLLDSLFPPPLQPNYQMDPNKILGFMHSDGSKAHISLNGHHDRADQAELTFVHEVFHLFDSWTFDSLNNLPWTQSDQDLTFTQLAAKAGLYEIVREYRARLAELTYYLDFKNQSARNPEVVLFDIFQPTDLYESFLKRGEINRIDVFNYVLDTNFPSDNQDEVIYWHEKFETPPLLYQVFYQNQNLAVSSPAEITQAERLHELYPWLTNYAYHSTPGTPESTSLDPSEFLVAKISYSVLGPRNSERDELFKLEREMKDAILALISNNLSGIRSVEDFLNLSHISDLSITSDQLQSGFEPKPRNGGRRARPHR